LTGQHRRDKTDAEAIDAAAAAAPAVDEVTRVRQNVDSRPSE